MANYYSTRLSTHVIGEVVFLTNGSEISVFVYAKGRSWALPCTIYKNKLKITYEAKM